MISKGFLLKLSIFLLICFSTIRVFAESSMAERQRQVKTQEAELESQDINVIESISQESILSDYIRMGLNRNPGLRAAFYQWKSALKKVPQAFSLPDPRFTFTDYIEEVETRVGPQQQAFSIKQKFPMFDKLWIKRSKAFKASEAVYYQLEKKRLELIYKITDVYYEYTYLFKSILLTKENMKLLRNFESVAQTKYASGLTKNQDLLKVQVELGKLESDLYSLEDFRVALVARLNALLNLPQDNVLPWPNEALEQIFQDAQYQQMERLIDVLKERNPQLLSLSESIGKAQQQLKLSKREYVPDVTLGVTQVNTGDALNPSMTDSGKDSIMMMFSVNVPIWFHRLKAGVDDAKAMIKATEHAHQNQENMLISKLAFVHYKLQDASRQSHLYKDGLIPKAVQALNATQSGYEAGKVDFLSLIDAQRVLLNFQLTFYRHNANFHQRLAELKNLIGEAYDE